MIDKEKIKDFVRDRIRKKSAKLNVSLDEIPDDFSLTGSGMFDSMDFVELMADVESAFNVQVDFSDADPEQFTTLQGFINCID